MRRAFAAVVAVICMLSACCATTSTSSTPRATLDTQVRTSLDVLADIIDPAYQVAMRSCRERGELAMNDGEAGRATGAETEAAVATIVARCHRVANAFEAIRLYHDEAVGRVEAGELVEAERLVERIRDVWRSLREDTP